MQDDNIYTTFEIQYSVQDLLLDIHEEKNQSKLAMVKVHAVV